MLPVGCTWQNLVISLYSQWLAHFAMVLWIVALLFLERGEFVMWWASSAAQIMLPSQAESRKHSIRTNKKKLCLIETLWSFVS